MDARLADLARARGGLITVTEAGRLAITPTMLSRLARSGRLVHLRRGAYALTESWSVASDIDQYAIRARAVLRTREGVAASHHGALLLAGVPLDRVTPERIHVCDATGTLERVRTKGVLTVHPRPARSRVLVDGFGDPYLDPANALILIARDDSALAAAVALEQALRTGATTVAAVGRALALHDERLGWARQFGALLDDADPLSPCPGATRLRILLTDLGFRPRLRVPLRDRGGQYLARPELLIGSSLAVVRTAYSSEVRDRLAEVGVVVAHVAEGDLDHPDRVAASIGAALNELSAIRETRPAS